MPNMLPRISTALLAVASSAYAVRDASPFFMMSTKPTTSDLTSQQLTIATNLESSLLSSLSTCDSTLYILIEHPGLRAHDLRHDTAMPKLQRRMQHGGYESIVQIPEVMGEVDIQHLASQLSSAKGCSTQQMTLEEYTTSTSKPSRAVVPLSQASMRHCPAAETELRRQSLIDTDVLVDSQLHSLLANKTEHTIIYAGVPLGEKHVQYEMEVGEGEEFMHTDLKRDVNEKARMGRRQADGGKVEWSQEGLPLFEKYQFLSPGIFMGLTVSILLFVILYVGVSAIAGLEVSYMSFSKEMGPQAQKKQQ